MWLELFSVPFNMFQFGPVIAPSLGCILGIVRHFIPIREIWAVRKSGQLGVRFCTSDAQLLSKKSEVEAVISSAAPQALNPIPFAAQILNCIGWVVYTVQSRNWYIFCTDAPGLLVSIWMTFSLYPYADRKARHSDSNSK